MASSLCRAGAPTGFRCRGERARGTRKRVQANAATEQQSDSLPEAREHSQDVVLVDTDSEDGKRRRIVMEAGAELDVQEVVDLCVRVGWARRHPNKLKTALENSYMVCTLHVERFDETAEQVEARKLIGMSRATSDHVFNATMWDILIDPEYQGMGLGKTLVEHSVRILLRRGISNISLFADATGEELRHQLALAPHAVVDFYKSLGFEPDPNGMKGMFFYPRF